jgi:hypothetical protein
MTKQFAYGCRSARHTMVESEIIDGFQLLRSQHDLQPFSPHQTGPSLAILHDSTSYKPAKQRKLGYDHLHSTYSFVNLVEYLLINVNLVSCDGMEPAENPPTHTAICVNSPIAGTR